MTATVGREGGAFTGATEAVLHLHRAANAVRQHVEQEVLRPRQLTWTGFVVLRTVWAARRIETRHVAEQAGISATGSSASCFPSRRTPRPTPFPPSNPPN
ncbi:hypothetical protein [Dactylosporangium matsuzakiense]|uniref:hypothetical protein n=1 Tax=Dactylosporangium matsuzakiense TaxID=53360 RepID=UPI0022F2F851|nr:hypothetical protein [Dactylosporangium matsuzakiense]